MMIRDNWLNISSKRISRCVQLLKNPWELKYLPYGIIAFGVFLRVIQYAYNRSLWIDEALLSINIVERSFAQLLNPLDYNQGAPIGFLFSVKIMTLLIGENEYSLRLISLIAGIMSIPIFYYLSIRFLSQHCSKIALFIFAFLPGLIYYSSEVKQYSTDVLFTLLLYHCGFLLLSQDMSLKTMILAIGLGMGAILFSHPVVFVMAGIGLTLALFAVMDRKWSRLFQLVGIGASWLCALCIVYFLFLRQLSQNDYLLGYWEGYFLPLLPRSLGDIRQYFDLPMKIFATPFGFTFTGIAAVLTILGVWWMVGNRPRELCLLASPIAALALASALHKYPFGDRMVLFISPFFVFMISIGIYTLIESALARKEFSRYIVGVCMFVLLMLHPFYEGIFHIFKPEMREHMNPLVMHIYENRKEGDIIYVYYAAKPAFEFYARKYRIDVDDKVVYGIKARRSWSDYSNDLAKLTGYRRAWVLFSHVYSMRGVDERILIKQLASTLGTEIYEVKSYDASVSLYELSRPVEISK